jgi:hypothetical protein
MPKFFVLFFVLILTSGLSTTDAQEIEVKASVVPLQGERTSRAFNKYILIIIESDPGNRALAVSWDSEHASGSSTVIWDNDPLRKLEEEPRKEGRSKKESFRRWLNLPPGEYEIRAVLERRDKNGIPEYFNDKTKLTIFR